LLGGAGSVEAIFAVLAMTRGVLPPTLNLETPSESVAGMDLVPLTAKEKKVSAVLSNSFGFGGTNASVVFKVAS
ncbi:MAG: beta-ketoacyl-ACP synthase II, partial [Rickettsiales bacterium]|nr:beta-ketoacyl-ACP synthase II [Rickettsiales bacterium]